MEQNQIEEKIINQMGGNVKVDSKLGIGT